MFTDNKINIDIIMKKISILTRSLNDTTFLSSLNKEELIAFYNDLDNKIKILRESERIELKKID